jgi:hypothetical protein
MGIQISDAVSQPAVIFDKVHVLELRISQPVFYDDSKSPQYVVVIEYRLYGIDEAGQRHYKGDTYEIEIKDFYSVAISQYQAGDPRLAQALAAIEQAIAVIIGQQMNIDASVI